MFIGNGTHRSISSPRGVCFHQPDIYVGIKVYFAIQSSSSFDRTARLQSLTSRKIKSNERIIKLSV
jgi:hypothetical protein